MSERLFIAISYDDNQLFKDLQESLAQKLQPLLKECKCTLNLQKHIHATVYFIGQQPIEKIDTIKDVCQQVLTKHVQEYGLHSLRDYSSKIPIKFIGHHGVIAVLFEPSSALSNLHALFVSAFKDTKKEESDYWLATTHASQVPVRRSLGRRLDRHDNAREFLPHATLARLKNISPKALKHFQHSAVKILHALSDTFQETIQLPAEEIILFSSDGMEYKELATFIV